MGLLRKVMGNKSKLQRERTWRSEAVVKVIKGAENQTLGAYIDKIQVTVSEWEELGKYWRSNICRPATRQGGGAVICGGGKQRLGSSSVRRQKIFWRCQGRGVGDPAGVAGAGEARKQRIVMQGQIGIGMLVQIQVTPRWENDHVWRNDGRKGREGRGVSGQPPPQADIGQRE